MKGKEKEGAAGANRILFWVEFEKSTNQTPDITLGGKLEHQKGWVSMVVGIRTQDLVFQNALPSA